MSGVTDLATAARSGRPNDRLVAPPGFCQAAEPDAPAPRFPVSPEALMTAMARLIEAEPRVRETARSADGLARQYVQRSKVFRFPDDVTVVALPAAGGSTLAIWSRARYGYADFGVNRARVERWLAAIEAAVGAAASPDHPQAAQ